MTPEISVVMPTFNRCDTLAVVLPAILEQATRRPYEVLLCDSGSTDGTAELVQRLQLDLAKRPVAPVLKHLTGPNRGRSGARNMGINAARGRLILFVDADIIADPELLEQHARTHERHADAHPGGKPCAVVGREVQVDDLDEYQRVRGNRSLQRTLHPDERTHLSWLYFLTGNASVPLETFKAVGGFDEAFVGYGHEDLELGYRLEQAGITIRYQYSAINYHWHPVGFEERCQKMRLAGASTVRFYAKHRDPRIKLRLGWNPASMALHWVLAHLGFVRRWVEARVEKRFWSELLLQYHYLTGLREALTTTTVSGT